jgi:hypothetical protein
MRIGGWLVVLSMLAAPVAASPIDYPLVIDETQSSLGISLGLFFGVDPNSPQEGEGLVMAYDSAPVGGTLDLRLDEAAGTAELLGFDAALTGALSLLLDAGDQGWVQLDSPSPGYDPISLHMISSGGAAPYDGSGNIVFPQVEASIAGNAYVTGEGNLAALIQFGLGLTLPGNLDLGALGANLKSDLPGVVDPAGGPQVSIPLSVSGADEPLGPGTGVWILYGVDGAIVTVPEPASLLLCAAGGAVMAALRRRR